ncbi:MAG: 3-oxoacyl-[acyl-carrier-protein] reductase [Deltaproteobacteria bacterium]|nr:3-oxoacyl-[acyl-carrier-protein] reductase [Deltaproteobacteria bacterium]
MKLEGKSALVTGGAQGIGKTVALLLAREGANVAVSDINADLAAATCGEIEALGRKSVAIEGNVADFKSTEEMMASVVDKMGSLDILVNNAGITRDTLLLRMKEEDWDAVISVNLKGTFNCSRAAVKYMSKQRSGKIVNIASIVGLMGNVGQANYAASKAGVIGLTKTTAREFAARGINVNAVAPGFIATAMTDAIPEKAKNELNAQIPMGRLGTPDDVAEAVLFLSGAASDYITGQVISVNGGMYM